MRLRNVCAVLAVAALAQGCAQTQDARVQQDLYQDALQSIAEGRRDDASRELREQIEKEPEHAGAWLDLAMTQCSLGHSDEAERMFATIETRFAPKEMTPGWYEMLRLIAEARENGCNHWHPSSAWSVAAGRGVDQNVNQGALSSMYVTSGPDGVTQHELTSDFLPMHDQYTQLSGDYTRDLSANGAIGFVQYAVRRNDRLHQYDSGAAFAGIDNPWRLGHWGLRGTLTGGLVTLGGSLYQRQVQGQLRIQPPLPLPAGIQFNLLLGGTYNGFLTLNNFNSNVWEERGLLTWRQPSRSASVTLGHLRDRALAQRPGGDRDGWIASATLRQHLVGPLGGELGFTRQDWNSSSAYAPGVIEEVRAQRTRVLRGNLTWLLDKHQSIQLEGRIVRNRENISIFQYNDRQLQLSWQWQGS
ncbi:hypothetical protein GCM10027321_19390 [Massilia terrae]|uniref:Tetratricopeptide repeat protein n=1 Tax=Massilia terrae TaxID=1811224 RepID=A0ABT2CYZ2_9BURK|nr:tetratricopeptide repeat protein [Massilia terrae]MCS0658400.1 tetratricopeptide repeat protein [Massilia terrae]